MKFSIVIPTRNRLEYLKTAVQSVLTQDYENWEIIVSDNASEQDISTYISSLNENRIKYFRLEKFVSVTENWNYAFNKSTGDYIIVIGDDDCLIQGSLSLLKKIAKENAIPELIFSNALLYGYPGVFSHAPNGLLCTVGNWHLWETKNPVLVNEKKLKKLVFESTNFRQFFSYNMQILTVHRSIVDKLKSYGNFFQSPYPDFYAMTMLFQKAERVLACPYPVVIVGVSPKSFGGNFFNDKETTGIKDLHVENETDNFPELKEVILPGTLFNTYWLFALRTAQKKLGRSEIKINFNRYRKLQIHEFLTSINGKSNKIEKFKEFRKKISSKELFSSSFYIFYIWLVEAIFGKDRSKIELDKRKAKEVHPNHVNYFFKKTYASIQEVLESITPSNCENLLKK